MHQNRGYVFMFEDGYFLAKGSSRDKTQFLKQAYFTESEVERTFLIDEGFMPLEAFRPSKVVTCFDVTEGQPFGRVAILESRTPGVTYNIKVASILPSKVNPNSYLGYVFMTSEGRYLHLAHVSESERDSDFYFETKQGLGSASVFQSVRLFNKVLVDIETKNNIKLDEGYVPVIVVITLNVPTEIKLITS